MGRSESIQNSIAPASGGARLYAGASIPILVRRAGDVFLPAGNRAEPFSGVSRGTRMVVEFELHHVPLALPERLPVVAVDSSALGARTSAAIGRMVFRKRDRPGGRHDWWKCAVFRFRCVCVGSLRPGPFLVVKLFGKVRGDPVDLRFWDHCDAVDRGAMASRISSPVHLA
jgi:hypothetical protein